MSAEAPAPSPMQPRPRPPVAKSNRAQIITFTLLTLLLSAVTEDPTPAALDAALRD